MGLWKLTLPSYGIFLFSTEQTSCKKTIIPYCSHDCAKTFPHSYALLYCLVLYKKRFFCETNNIFYSIENRIWDKTKWQFWNYIKNKGKVTLESFQNLPYVSSYLYLKGFAWKQDYLISQKLQMSQTLSRLF